MVRPTGQTSCNPDDKLRSHRPLLQQPKNPTKAQRTRAHSYDQSHLLKAMLKDLK